MNIKITLVKEKRPDTKKYEIIESVHKNCKSRQNLSGNMVIQM